MKNKKSKRLVLTAIILIILIIVFFPKNQEQTSEQVAKCIGERATLYVQLGCPHCRTQENIFGENLQYLNIVDCYETPEECSVIRATPSWRIDNQTYLGIQSIEKLRELTGC
jgi:hypothetical protein